MTFNFGGGSTAPATGLNFGSTATNPAQNTGFGFGASAAKQPAGVSFGAATGTPTAAVAPLQAAVKPAAVSFGAAAGTGLTLNFGTPAATAAPPAFGAAAATTAAPPAFGGFGAPAASSATAFGAPAASSAPTAFGAPAASSATAFGAPAPAAFGAASGFGFGTTTTISQAPAAGLNLNTTTTTGTPGFGSLGGLGGLGGTTTTSSGLGGAPAVAGLGGASTAAGQVQTTQEGKVEGKAVKESMIPNELGSTVEDLKKIMKEEKSVSSDISHVSAKPYNKIKDETEALSQLVNVLAIGVQKNRAALDRLKADTAQELVNVETAQRTKETPPAMQYENVAPLDFFNRLVGQFEVQMTNYRKQIEQTELHLQAMGNDSIQSQDLTRALQKLHEAFTDLASKYGGIHHEVAKQKEHYLNIHRHLHGTNTSLFDRKSSVVVRKSPALPSLVGPSPFTGPQDPLAQARAHLLNHSQQPGPNQTGPPTLGLSSMGTNPAFKPAAGTGFGANTSGFGANTTGFGGSSTGFGANTSGFGANTTGFGANTTVFGASTSGFGGGFASPAPAFGAASSSVFGSPTSGNKRGKH